MKLDTLKITKERRFIEIKNSKRYTFTQVSFVVGDEQTYSYKDVFWNLHSEFKTSVCRILCFPDYCIISFTQNWMILLDRMSAIIFSLQKNLCHISRKVWNYIIVGSYLGMKLHVSISTKRSFQFYLRYCNRHRQDISLEALRTTPVALVIITNNALSNIIY